jgi:hypothetical protein
MSAGTEPQPRPEPTSAAERVDGLGNLGLVDLAACFGVGGRWYSPST